MQKVGVSGADPTPRRYGTRGAIASILTGSSLARLAALGMTFVFSITVARILGPHDAGVVFAAVVAVSGTGMIARVGTDLVVIRRGAALHSVHRLTRERLGWSRLLRLAMANSFAIAVAATIFFQVLLGNGWVLLPYTIFALSIPFQCLAVLCSSLLRAAGHSAKGAFAEVGLAQGVAAVASIVLHVLGYANIYVVSATFTVATALVGTWALVSSRSVWQDEGRAEHDAPTLTRTPARWRELLATMWSSVLFYALTWSPLGVLVVLSTNEQVAMYGAAARFPTLIALIPTVQLTGTLPVIAALVAHRRIDEANAEIQKINRLAAMLALAAMIVLVVGAPWIMRIFGDEFVDAAPALRVLVLGQLVAVALGPASLVPLVTGFENSALKALAATCVLGVAAEAALAVQWGAVGAAAGWSLAMAAFGSAMVLRLRRDAGIVLNVTVPGRSS